MSWECTQVHFNIHTPFPSSGHGKRRFIKTRFPQGALQLMLEHSAK